MAKKDRGQKAGSEPRLTEKGAAPAAPEMPAAPPAPVAATPSWQGELPLFYKNPQLLTAERHQSFGLRETVDFGFARDTNSVPLGANELFPAHFSFPVVFTESNPPLPVAVLGVGANRNSFVDDKGGWRDAAYVPAYIRRYPFILATGIAPGQIHLAIDEAAGSLTKDSGRKLFEGGQPSPLTAQAAEFCRAFQAEFDLARAFGEALQAANLLVSKRVDIQQPDGTRQTLKQFRVVDEARYDALPDPAFLAWRRRGWLGLVYAHLLSMRRWQGFGAPAAGAV
ncbi:MAG TPA: SapC family protein [Stellaceae bacterium]|nr:SapC family protein [Stellaceae bacterium]